MIISLCRTGLLIGLAFSLAAPVGASRVEVARAPETDFASYESYGFRFKEGLNPENALSSETPVYREIVGAADKTLARKGMRRDQESPDLWIEFQGLMQEGLTIEGAVSKTVGNVTWVGDPNAFSMQTVRTGTLIVEVYDAASGERVWSGWTNENAATAEKIRKKAGKAAQKIFKEFPAQ